MTTMTAAATMTAEERLATEAFRADLVAEFREATSLLPIAQAAGPDAETRVREIVRHTYREIKEVEYCLTTNVLPF